MNHNDIYTFELAKFIHKLFHDKLPQIFQSRFVKTAQIHSHDTRSVEKCTCFLSRVRKSVCQNSLTFGGTKMWNEIDKAFKNKILVFSKNYSDKFCLNGTKTKSAA